MILLIERIPDAFSDLVRTNARLETRVNIKPNLSLSTEKTYERYRSHADYLFMVGYLVALKEVPCAGNITLIAVNGTSAVTGSVDYWRKESGIIIDEVGDILTVAAKRFCTNHPRASVSVSVTLEPFAISHQGKFLGPPTRRS